MKGKVWLDGRWDQVQKGQHGKDGREHVVVHNGMVTREGGRNHISD